MDRSGKSRKGEGRGAQRTAGGSRRGEPQGAGADSRRGELQRAGADSRRGGTQRGGTDSRGTDTGTPGKQRAGDGTQAHAGASPKRGATQARVLRIIGGTWRGRKLRFPPSPEIRPTPDRVRETLFNWLSPRLPGSRCLDLFAGSGALGLESLSRGASHVTFVECDAAAVRELRTRLTEWGASGAEVAQGEALRFLSGSGTGGRPFDIVFLDPPFDSDLVVKAAEQLEKGGWLAAGALIYVECAARKGLPPLPPTWSATKSKQAGEVGYHLLTKGLEGTRGE